MGSDDVSPAHAGLPQGRGVPGQPRDKSQDKSQDKISVIKPRQGSSRLQVTTEFRYFPALHHPIHGEMRYAQAEFAALKPRAPGSGILWASCIPAPGSPEPPSSRSDVLKHPGKHGLGAEGVEIPFPGRRAPGPARSLAITVPAGAMCSDPEPGVLRPPFPSLPIPCQAAASLRPRPHVLPKP